MPQSGSSGWPAAESPVLDAPTKGTGTTLSSAGDAHRDHDQWHADVSALLIAIQAGLVAHELGGATYHKVTADLPMGTHKITGLGTPSASTDAATKAYVDATAQGLSPKASVKGASTTNHSVSAFSGSTIDGGSVSLSNGDRILLKDQSTTSQNGPWVFNGAGSALSRPADFATGSQQAGAFVFVESGTANAGRGYVLASTAVTVDTTAQTWTQFSGAGEITAGAGLTKTGDTLNVVANADATITVNADDIQVAAGGITNTQVNAAAAIAYSKLVLTGAVVNADIASAAAIAYSKLVLTGAVVNADIASAAAIAYSKLALTGAVVNADINAAAAIATSKLADSALITGALQSSWALKGHTTSDFSKGGAATGGGAGDTTLADVPLMVFSIAANDVWQFEFVVFYDGSTTGDIKTGITVPSGATITYWPLGIATSAVNLTADSITDNVQSTSPGAPTWGAVGVGSKAAGMLKGIVVNGANAGSVQLQAAQATADGTNATRVYTNSYFRAFRES